MKKELNGLIDEWFSLYSSYHDVEDKRSYAAQKSRYQLTKMNQLKTKIVKIVSMGVSQDERLSGVVVELNTLSGNDARISSLFTALKEHFPDIEEVKDVQFKKPKKLPGAIKDEVLEDIKEMEQCFSSGCYRAATIICGRLLETALHRKYYDATGVDLLEKSPGIGLGNLIAKLRDKEVSFDPGITQQIHLVNQVRIFTVHKKQEVFYPSKEQCTAIILYTLDSIGKMFE